MKIIDHNKEFSAYGNKFFVFAFVLVFLFVLLRTAWISDDAAITLRTVLNFIHGFGPTFNIEERVQAYTHPLWFLFLSLGSAVFGNVFYTTFTVSIITSVAAFSLLLGKLPRNTYVLILVGLAAILSKSFIDFSTSGLENPLSHLILFFAVSLASSCIEKDKSRLVMFFLMCSALYLNRPDLLVMVFPLAIYLMLSAIRYPKLLLASLSIAAVPVFAWTAFSLFYYGFPFPNTAYAKLGTGIALDERIIQGFKYFLHSIYSDPITIFLIAAGVTIGFLGSSLSKLLSVGVLLYLVYVLNIGGDFMEGRFLTAPFFMSLVILARELSSRLSAIALLVPVIILGTLNIAPNILAGPSYSNLKISNNGIADERGFYYQQFGLLTAAKNTFTSPQWQVSDPKVAVICGGLGFNSIIQGPGMHYIDNCALTDPLLARLPAKENPNWRVGHFYRQLPTNYRESIEQGDNLLIDQKTKIYWDSIRTVTRGPLLDKNRLFEIARLNLGVVEKPDLEMYRLKNIPISTIIPIITESDIRKIANDGTSWNAQGNTVFYSSLDIALMHKKNIKTIDLSVDHNDIYNIFGLSNQDWVLLTTISPTSNPGLARHIIVLENTITNIRKIRVTATSGDGMYSIGHLLINTQ